MRILRIGRLLVYWAEDVEYCLIGSWTTPPDGQVHFPYREYCLRIGHLLVSYILPLREARGR